ncbi:hypothetical protein COUCH_32865 [Couchioplanes caeruleus]|uniref:hypothetical protein n=1 Tax=Couchioplanes caeruleus TaxID=56438 RepID=UPI0020BE308F|nr:hypothetical protein [Couchioplanes caeruleus]UQU63734.1 hypothetical protein COUCH_32865 [Couchioplanes caeruleus]
MAEGILIAVAIVAAVAVAAGVRSDEPPWFQCARVLGWILVGDTAFYLGSVIVGLLTVGGWPELADLSWEVVILTLANAPLIWLGASLARRR